jgi:hypothetical protein
MYLNNLNPRDNQLVNNVKKPKHRQNSGLAQVYGIPRLTQMPSLLGRRQIGIDSREMKAVK